MQIPQSTYELYRAYSRQMGLNKIRADRQIKRLAYQITCGMHSTKLQGFADSFGKPTFTSLALPLYLKPRNS